MGVIRSLLIRLGIQADTKKIADVEKKVESVTSEMKEAAKAAREWRKEMAQKFTLGVTAAAAAVGASTKAVVDNANQVHIMAEALGISVVEMQRMAYAAETTGQDLQTMHDAMQTMGERARDAIVDGPTSDAATMIKQLGIVTKDANGNLLDNATITKNMADALSAMPNDTARAAAAMTLLGDDGVRLLPILNKGSAFLEALGDEAERVGFVMSQETIEQSRKLGIEMQRANASVKGLRAAIALELMPRMNDLVSRFNSWIQEGNNAEKATEVLIKATKALSLALAAVGFAKALAGFKALILSIRGTIVAMKIARVEGTLLQRTLLRFAAPAAAIAALVILLQDVYVWLTGGESLVGDFIDRWKESDSVFGDLARWLIFIKPALQDMLQQGIAFAKRVLPPLLAMLQRLVQMLVSKVLPIVQKVGAQAAVSFMRAIETLQNFVLPLLEELAGAFLDAADELLPVVLDLVDTIQDSIFDLVVSLLPVIRELVLTVIGLVRSLLPLVGQVIKLLVKIIAKLLKIIVPIIANLIKTVVKIIVALVPVVTKIIKVVIKIINALIPIVTRVFEAIAEITAKVIPIITDVILTVVDLVTDAIDFITPIIETIIDVVGGVISFIATVSNGLVEFFTPIVKKFVSFWAGLVEFVSPIIDKVGSVIMAVLGPIIESVEAVIGGIEKAKNFLSGGKKVKAGDMAAQALKNFNAQAQKTVAADAQAAVVTTTNSQASKDNSVNVNTLQVQVQSVNNDPAEIARKAREGVTGSLGDLQRRQAARDLAAGG